MNQIENTKNQFSDAIKELQIGKLMRKSNITKFCDTKATLGGIINRINSYKL